MGESKLLPYFDWGVVITRLIMTGESLFGGFIIARDTGCVKLLEAGEFEKKREE